MSRCGLQLVTAVAALVLPLATALAVDQPREVSTQPSRATDLHPAHSRSGPIVYGEKYGLAMTMEVVRPADANGRGIIFVVSGGWKSQQAMIDWVPLEFLRRGYTVFAVRHGSTPRFTAPEIVADLHRAVRYIRHHANDYGVDPDRLGIYGASSGGHLSLMIGTTGGPGDPQAADPVDRQTSRVAAVACFFPPTDFLNYGSEGVCVLDSDRPAFAGGFNFQEFNAETHRLEPITDPQRRRQLGQEVSPIYHVSPGDAPTLIIHGDRDERVPLQQAQIMISRLREVGVEAQLIVKEGAGHGWPRWQQDVAPMADWFDRHLR